MLNLQKSRYENKEKYLSHFDMAYLLKPLKQEFEWLKEVSHATLNISCADLDKSYKKAFKDKKGFPKFKSKKKDKLSYPIVNQTGKFYFQEDFVFIQKLGKIKYQTNYKIPQGRDCKFTNPRLTITPKGKYIVSFGMEVENQEQVLNDYNVGIDLGIKDLAIVSYNGENIKTFNNINKSKKMRMLNKRLKHLQRDVSRKYENNKQGKKYKKTNNIIKREQTIKILYERITNIRKNYLHQTTSEIIKLLPKQIIIEDLNVIGMMKNKHLSKAISEQCFYEFIRQITYKSEWNGIKLVKANRFYPSSKTCHSCGNIKKDLKLSDRTYKCDCCGYVKDRDINASLNLQMYSA